MSEHDPAALEGQHPTEGTNVAMDGGTRTSGDLEPEVCTVCCLRLKIKHVVISPSLPGTTLTITLAQVRQIKTVQLG